MLTGTKSITDLSSRGELPFFLSIKSVCIDSTLQKPAGFFGEDGQRILDVLQVVALPGHTADCIGLLDTRTGTLLSGDGLQMYGIYGSGAWGANISYIKEHLALGKTLREKEISVIAASHDYHPCGWKAEGEAVGPYIAECAAALRAVGDFARANPDDNNEELAARYNASSGLPTVGAHVFAAVRNTMAAGEM